MDGQASHHQMADDGEDVQVDGDQTQQQARPIIQNTTPAFVQHCFYMAVGIIEKYGWFILIGIIFLVYLWYKFRPQIMKMMKKWEDQQYMKTYDPIKAAEVQTRMDESRRRWQEVQDAKAAKYEEEKKRLEEEKRQEMIEDWENHKQGKGYRSKKYKKPDDTTLAENMLKPKKKKPLRNTDYNPLSGGGGGSSYRPSRRGGGGGGG